MKTVCKKLLCLMLVAMMLISAVPFAFAAGTACTTCGSTNTTLYAGSNGVVSSSSKLATCTETGMDVYHCNAATCGAYFGVEVPKKDHDYQVDDAASTDATCTADGKTVSVCSICGDTKEETIAKSGHDFDNGALTVAATCTTDGIKTYTCKTCQYAYEDVIAATGHNIVDNACTKCNFAEDPIDAITFYFLDKNGNETSAVRYVYEDGAHITPPAVPVNPVSGFSYWAENKNGGGDTINADETLVYNSQTPNAFHAIYNKKSAMSELKIYVVRYVNGVRKEANYLFSKHFTTSNDNNMYQYLWDNADEIRTAGINELGEGYTWNNKFYNYFTDEELTTSNMKDNGNKSVYIKMNTKNSNESQVLLYIHKGKTSTVSDILEMNGYNAGETVYLNDVKEFLKDEGYKWSSISSLYTDEEYDDLMDGESPSGSNSIKIYDNGTYKIHVILNGASQSSNADSSNPKTGDSIMVAVTTMTLAAAALVAVVELKKRKMI